MAVYLQVPGVVQVDSQIRTSVEFRLVSGIDLSNPPVMSRVPRTTFAVSSPTRLIGLVDDMRDYLVDGPWVGQIWPRNME